MERDDTSTHIANTGSHFTIMCHCYHEKTGLTARGCPGVSDRIPTKCETVPRLGMHDCMRHNSVLDLCRCNDANIDNTNMPDMLHLGMHDLWIMDGCCKCKNTCNTCVPLTRALYASWGGVNACSKLMDVCPDMCKPLSVTLPLAVTPPFVLESCVRTAAPGLAVLA